MLTCTERVKKLCMNRTKTYKNWAFEENDLSFLIHRTDKCVSYAPKSRVDGICSS